MNPWGCWGLSCELVVGELFSKTFQKEVIAIKQLMCHFTGGRCQCFGSAGGRKEWHIVFPFVELQEILVDLFLQFVEVPWMAAKLYGVLATSSNIVSPANMLRVHSLPSSGSLMKRLSSIGPINDPWDAQLVTGLQLDFVPLITTIWAWQFIQFSSHLVLYLSSLYFISFSVRTLWDTVLNVLLKSGWKRHTGIPSSILPFLTL